MHHFNVRGGVISGVKITQNPVIALLPTGHVQRLNLKTFALMPMGLNELVPLIIFIIITHYCVLLLEIASF